MSVNLKDIFSRKKEITFLDNILSLNKAVFLAVYGRRRIGKTFLIKSFFQSQKKILWFEVTGKKNANTAMQLEIFYDSLVKSFPDLYETAVPKNWKQAFKTLNNQIERIDKNKKVVIFLDELPWLAGKKPDLLSWIDFYWNSQWVKNKNFIFIVCGSAAGWMLEKLIHNKGGLHNRITHRMHLQALSLSETKQYLQAKNFKWNNQQIIEAYACTGGVPFYLDQLKKSLSAAQNIQTMCFNKNGLMYDEYERLFASLFNNHEIYEKIVSFLASQNKPCKRSRLINQLKLPKGGRTYKRLSELLAANFITQLDNKRDPELIVSDEFCLFHNRWLSSLGRTLPSNPPNNYWLKKRNTAEWYNWFGYAFESIVYKHINEVAEVLGIHNLNYKTHFNWSYKGHKGAQIDLIFDRQDEVVTLCEIKSSLKPLAVDQKLALELLKKAEIYREATKTKKEIKQCLIVLNTVKKSALLKELGVSVVNLSKIML